MKIFTKKSAVICVFILFLSLNTFSQTSYVSAGAGPAAWNVATSWTPNGIPGTNDDVTISAGHTITIPSLQYCNNLTVDGTIQWTANVGVITKGNYVLTGNELGTGKLQFNTPGTTLSVTGTTGNSVAYNFNTSRTILAGSTLSKTSSNTTVAAGKTVTNLGTFTIGATVTYAGSTFVNGANSTLILRFNGFFTGRTFDASASNNLVRTLYNTGNIPITTAGYYNLHLAGTATGTKSLLGNTIVLNNLTINATNTLNTNNFNLSVGGNWSSAGTLLATAGETITFDGTAAQTISNTSGTTTFKGLTIDNTAGVTLTTGTYLLNEVLTVTDGTFNTGGRPFTMTSTAAQTARIAPISGSGAIAGNFTVQRFISTRDTTYCDLSSPVQSSTFADWESELIYVNYTDAPPTSIASGYTYDEAADSYVAVTSSGTFLAPGQGFETYLSGGGFYANFPSTTLTTVGVPNQGDHDLTSSISNAVQGWNLVGNPFASNIAWSTIYSDPGTSGLEDYIEMYDYTIQDWNGYTSADAIEIAPTQGFWVYGLPGNGAVTLNIPETSKTTTSVSDIKASNKIQPYFILKLSNTSSNFAHKFKVATSDIASNGLDSKDIAFRPSPNKATPQMYCEIDGKKININNFNSSNDSYSIPLKTKVTISGNYKIEASGFDFVDYTCIKLQDNLSGKVIDLTTNPYCFSMNSTDNPDRFTLLFSKDGACKSAEIATSTSLDFSNQIEILPSLQGNTVNFNLSEITSTNISVINVLGQTIVETITLDASNQSIGITLPEGFTGLYFIKIESSKGSITKKFVKK